MKLIFRYALLLILTALCVGGCKSTAKKGAQTAVKGATAVPKAVGGKAVDAVKPEKPSAKDAISR